MGLLITGHECIAEQGSGLRLMGSRGHGALKTEHLYKLGVDIYCLKVTDVC